MSYGTSFDTAFKRRRGWEASLDGGWGLGALCMGKVMCGFKPDLYIIYCAVLGTQYMVIVILKPLLCEILVRCEINGRIAALNRNFFEHCHYILVLDVPCLAPVVQTDQSAC